MQLARILAAASVVALGVAACGTSSSSSTPSAPDDAGGVDLGAPPADGGSGDDDSGKVLVDGGYAGPDGSVLPADRFVTQVVSFMPGDCAGFGVTKMPGVVEGPPVGGGALMGSLDVVSLGFEGSIVLSFDPNAIVDGPGPDFIVFENAFYAGGDPNSPSDDLGDVSVSDDGATWKTFPCNPGPTPPYPGCAGWHPVYSAPGNGVSPVDPAAAGGEAFDLADVGLKHARYVRIRDLGRTPCPQTPPKPTTVGFDLDAVSIVNGAL